MPDSAFLALFLVGLLGGTHCIGMCGGIVGALSMGSVGGVGRLGNLGKTSGASTRLTIHLAYNGGRILSYTLAGAFAGLLGGASLLLTEQWPLRIALYVLANLMLVALGLYLMGITWLLALTERAGQGLWRRIQPMTRRFLPVRTPVQAFPLGMLWGWLPCGMVYSALMTALTSGSAGRGALLMLAFGMGTLPNLLLAGFLWSRLREVVQHRLVRTLSGLLVIGFGVWGLIGVRHLMMSYSG